MIKLYDEFDNPVIINPNFIGKYEICNLQDGYLGVIITYTTGETQKFNTCIRDIRNKLNDLERTRKDS